MHCFPALSHSEVPINTLYLDFKTRDSVPLSFGNLTVPKNSLWLFSLTFNANHGVLLYIWAIVALKDSLFVWENNDFKLYIAFFYGVAS